MKLNDPNELAERYTAVWMEPDGDRRRKAIADLWSEDATHILQPTQEVYDATRDAFDWSFARERKLKGVGEVKLHRARRPNENGA